MATQRYRDNYSGIKWETDAVDEPVVYCRGQWHSRDSKPVILDRDSRNIVSCAAAVMPEQISEAQARVDQAGIKARYRKDGCPVFADAQAQRRFCREFGYVNRDDNASPRNL